MKSTAADPTGVRAISTPRRTPTRSMATVGSRRATSAILDAAGHLTVTGRAKDLIIRNGFNISPAEVENALLMCSGVKDVAVVGVPDDNTGERAIAFVEAGGSVTPTLADLTSHLANIGMAKPKWPEELRLVKTFPRTASGKVQKYKLRNDIRATR